MSLGLYRKGSVTFVPIKLPSGSTLYLFDSKLYSGKWCGQSRASSFGHRNACLFFAGDLSSMLWTPSPWSCCSFLRSSLRGVLPQVSNPSAVRIKASPSGQHRSILSLRPCLALRNTKMRRTLSDHRILRAFSQCYDNSCCPIQVEEDSIKVSTW